MRLTLITPRIAVQKGDFLGSGIPYWPIELATLAGQLRTADESVSVIDLFGRAPSRLSDGGDHYLQGMPIGEHVRHDAVQGAEGFILYAISYMSHQELVDIIRTLKQARPDAWVAVLENSQAVTAYSLQRVADELFRAGADVLVCGEAYFNWSEIKAFLADPETRPIPANVIARNGPRTPRRITAKSTRYPLPAWDLFQLKSYWSIPYSHGPKTRRFLPILTSRGCPYSCDFCVVPETNDRRWRGNSPTEVVREILELRDRFGVRDFQVEDLNPTVSHTRWEEICRLLIERNANIRFYLVSGTKAETVRIDQVPLLAAAGCRYISISPESGSLRVMKAIGKPFDYEHGLDLVSACRANGIYTQACFLVGHPSESEDDFKRSCAYLVRLVAAGLDEVAVFIVAPFAGSALFAQDRIFLQDHAALVSFSPRGRGDHATVARRRRQLIRVFVREKLRRGPDLWLQAVRSLCGIPRTKMENLPRRAAYIAWLVTKAKIKAVAARPSSA
ncbi:MAG: B12-binding domain-containing radical SAM protein [Gammaproteobacteria bacterium]